MADEANVTYVRELSSDRVGEVIEEDTEDSATPHRVQWEDGATEWINAGDTTRYEMT